MNGCRPQGTQNPGYRVIKLRGVSIVGLMRWPVTSETTGSNPVRPANLGGSMNKLEEIIDLLGDTDQPIVKSLFRFKSIAFDLNAEEITTWINCEINGYPDDAILPDYRIVPATIKAHLAGPYGSSMSNITIGTHHLSEEEHDSISRLRLRSSIQFYENLDQGFSFPVPPVYYRRLEDGFTSHMHIYSASLIPTASAVDDILSAVRSRFLDFLLMANEKIETDSVKHIKSDKKEEVGIMFKNVVLHPGSTVNVVINSPHATTSADRNSTTLMYTKELLDGGIKNEDVDEVNNLLDSNKEKIEKKNISFLDKWIEKVTSYSGDFSKAMIIDILIKLIQAKFGIAIT